MHRDSGTEEEYFVYGLKDLIMYLSTWLGDKGELHAFLSAIIGRAEARSPVLLENGTLHTRPQLITAGLRWYGSWAP